MSGTGSGGSTGPLRAVLTALQDGAPSLHDVCARTQLDRSVVEAAVDHLVRMGRVSAKELAIGCPGGGCGSCASGVDGSPGCGAHGASGTRSGPVLVALSVRPGRRQPDGGRELWRDS